MDQFFVRLSNIAIFALLRAENCMIVQRIVDDRISCREKNAFKLGSDEWLGSIYIYVSIATTSQFHFKFDLTVGRKVPTSESLLASRYERKVCDGLRKG